MAYPLVAACRTPFPTGTTVEHFTRNTRIDFHSRFYWFNINSTALFKSAFLGLDLAGKPFGGDFEKLSPRMGEKKTHMFPIARLAIGLPSGGHRPYTPFPQGIILQHSRFPTWKEEAH